MAAAANADDYAVTRQNFFFPANNNTPVDGNLTGQCVTLLKWFFAEMCDNFPSPFAARGNARFVGQNLVAQGLATEVPYSDRRRGDVICYEYGQYGHIASQLSGGRVFEENVNLGGVSRRLVAGAYVYASRIGNENEAWRADKNPHVYRLKSYNETGASNMKPTAQQAHDTVLAFETEADGITPHQPTQADLDFGVSTEWAAYIPNFYPMVQVLRDKIKLLTEDRDNNLYPYINAVTNALGLPVGATADDCVKAIEALKAGGGVKPTPLAKGIYEVK